MSTLKLIAYSVLAYWAVSQTVYKYYIMVGNPIEVFTRKAIFCFTLGIILIPIAVLQLILHKQIWKGKNNIDNNNHHGSNSNPYNIDDL